MAIKILSWNIWIDGDFDEITDFIKKSNADIIGLQEVKDDEPKIDIISHLKSKGYDYVFAPIGHSWKGKKYIHGSAIFSKYKINSTKTHHLHQKEDRFAIQANIEVNDKVLHVFSTHLIHTHQQSSDVQEEQMNNLIEVLPRERTIVMGDFNATPESEAVRKIAKVLVDADSESLPTWSMYPAGCETCNPQTVDTRLDYIFVTPDLKIHSFEVGESKGSDHLPISVTIEL